MGVGKPDGEEDADDTKATFAQLMVWITQHQRISASDVHAAASCGARGEWSRCASLLATG